MWSDEQKSIIYSKANVIQVIAAAGSGKTATMVGLLKERERDPKFEPSKTLVVTFTKKATSEFRARCKKNELSTEYQISTFHSFCFGILKKFHPKYKSNKLKVLSEHLKWKKVKEILFPYRFLIGGLPFPILLKNHGYYLKRISELAFLKFYNEFHHFKNSNFYFELEDLLIDFLNLIQTDPIVCDEIKKSFTTIIVDEFQDTDPMQLDILKVLNPKSLVVVGDDWQAIYGFRGATPIPFLNFKFSFPDVVQYHLSTNYRSTEIIIQNSQTPIRKNKSQIQKSVLSFRKETGSFLLKQIQNPNIDLERIYRQYPSGTMILVRTNYRKSVWTKSGIPKENVMTIHASKGLEFKSVLVDLSSGWGKIKHSDIEEERRILYVALSRAEDHLALLLPQDPKEGQIHSEFASYFLKGRILSKLALRYVRFW